MTYIHNPEVAHETSDVNIKAILQFTVGLLAIGIVVSILMWFYAQSIRETECKAGPKITTRPNGFGLRRNDFQLSQGFKPRLVLVTIWISVTVRTWNCYRLPPEYIVLSERWRAVLEHGQKDPATGVMTAIPIEQAMKEIIKQGLPSRPAAAGQETFDQAREVPAYSSAGRTMEVRRQ